MPFVFVIFGLLVLIVGIRGTQDTMFKLLRAEFTGPHSFIPWAAAIFILGALGYAKPIRPVADAMIGLVLLVILLQNKGGFFASLNQQISNPQAPAQPAQTAQDQGQGFTPLYQTLTPSNPGTAGVNYLPGVTY